MALACVLFLATVSGGLSASIRANQRCRIIPSIPGYSFQSLSVLQVAVLVNATEDIDQLVEAGCDPNYDDAFLTYTDTKCSSAILTRLNISCSREVRVDGFTPLNLAVNLASTAVVEKLVAVPGINLDAKSTDDVNPPIYDAAGKGKLDVVKVLAEAGADINNVGGPSGVSPVGRAILAGHTEIVRYLISRGADVTVRDLDGDSPAFLAALRGDLEIIKMLRKAGADLEAAGGRNKVSLLTIAAEKGDLKVVEYLIDQRVDVDQEGIDGDTAVFVASSSGSENLDILKALRVAGADLSVPSSKEKYTALHAAIITGRTETAIYLIEQGADPSARTASGNTPAFEASVKGNLEVVQAIGRAGGDLETARGPSSVTPVAAAAAYGFEEVVAFLVNSGVETGARDGTGRTALDWADEGGHDGIVRLLTL